MYSAAFEVLLFETLARSPFTRLGLARADKALRESHQVMCRKLDFRMEIADPVSRNGRAR